MRYGRDVLVLVTVTTNAEPTLTGYDRRDFPPTAVAVDVVVLTVRAGHLSVLLVQRGMPPFTGVWALPGGFVRPDETLDEAAERELAEETGLVQLPGGAHLDQLRTYGDPERDPRMRVVSVAYLALVPDLPRPEDGGDATLAQFWAVDDLAGADNVRLAFDHSRILGDALERARSKLEYTPLAAAFCEEPFTLAELRRVYEAAWGVVLDPANFRRKVLSTRGFVVPLGETASGRTGGRPAELYRRGGATALHPPMLRPTATGDSRVSR